MNEFRDLITPTVIAMFGGVAGYTMRKGARDIWQFLSDMIISMFVGILVYFILDNYKISASWKVVIIALSGFMAREVLIIATKKFMTTVKKAADIQDENNKNAGNN